MKLKWKGPFLAKLEGFYEGEVKEGVPHGVGVFTIYEPDYRRGDTFQGTWVDGVMQGFAFHQINKDMSFFYVVDGKAHGKCILYLADEERRHFHQEWHKGRQFGVSRSFTRGKNTGQVIFTRRRM